MDGGKNRNRSGKRWFRLLGMMLCLSLLLTACAVTTGTNGEDPLAGSTEIDTTEQTQPAEEVPAVQEEVPAVQEEIAAQEEPAVQGAVRLKPIKGTVWGEMKDGLTELCSIAYADGTKGLAVKDIRHADGQFLGEFERGAVLPDDTVIAYTQEKLCSFSAADGYVQAEEWQLPAECGVLLHVEYDAASGSYLMVFDSMAQAGGYYGIAHCRWGGSPDYITVTSIPVTEKQIHFVTLLDGLLTVEADTTVNLEGEMRAHFIYNIVTHEVCDLSGEN